MIAGFASVLGKQARGTVLLEATQQTKHLTPLQADQHTGVSNTQTTRLNPQQHVKTAELLLAHRQHRHGAPPGTPEPGGVSPLSCRGVSSLYCAYTRKSHNRRSGKSACHPLPCCASTSWSACAEFTLRAYARIAAAAGGVALVKSLSNWCIRSAARAISPFERTMLKTVICGPGSCDFVVLITK